MATSIATSAPAGAAPSAHPPHPSVFQPANLILLAVLSVFGAVIGIQLLVTLGVTPNTSIIGALVAMILARIPLQMFHGYRSVHFQNLAQSSISSATFGAANSLLLPIAVPFVLGRPDLVMPVFLGVSCAMLLDGYLLYRFFNTKVFPATGAWPPGVAAAEAIKAGDTGGKQAVLLGAGMAVGASGAWFGIPMSAFGTAFIGNIWALSMFGVGLLLRGYAQPVFGMDINKAYIPHGVMIGAGLVALVQVVMIIVKRSPEVAPGEPPSSESSIGKTMGFGGVAYLVLAAGVAAIAGVVGELSGPMLVAFVLYAAFAAFVHELIVGIAAMHSGWFPAFAVALITLLIGMLIGFPVASLAVLCSFTVATGPAFADMGYDLKAGFMLRGNGADPAFEMAGRRQQLMAAMLAFLIAIPVVFITKDIYFSQGLVPPVAKVYAATINAGAVAGITQSLFLWAIPGALIQLIGGPKRQLGVLLATGLLIFNVKAGWAVLIGIAIRAMLEKIYGDRMRNPMEIFAGGVIAGDALYSFFNAVFSSSNTLKK